VAVAGEREQPEMDAAVAPLDALQADGHDLSFELTRLYVAIMLSVGDQAAAIFLDSQREFLRDQVAPRTNQPATDQTAVFSLDGHAVQRPAGVVTSPQCPEVLRDDATDRTASA